ncbi:MAG: hypothetical protein ACTSXF_09995 [Promethearchaeota archaeon]
MSKNENDGHKQENEHSKLDANIDGNLMYSLFSNPSYRQLLSLLFIIHDDLFLDNNFERFSQFSKIMNDENLKDHPDVYDRNFLDRLIEYGFIEVEDYEELEKMANSKKVIKKINPFEFMDDYSSYIIILEDFLKILRKFYPTWTLEKVLNVAYNLNGIRCPKFNVIHQILVVFKDVDEEDVMIFPEDTYDILLELKLVNKGFFKYESKILKIMDEIKIKENSLNNYLREIFPPILTRQKQIISIIKKCDKLKKSDYIKYMLDNMDEPFKIIEIPPAISEAFKDYVLWKSGINNIFRNLTNLKKIKNDLKKIFNKYFSEGAEIHYKNIIKNIIPKQEKYSEFEDEIRAALDKFEKMPTPSPVDLINLKIAYHKLAIFWLNEEKSQYDQD